MKRILYLLTAASVAAVPVFAGNSAVGASGKQTLDAVQNTSTNGQGFVVQNDATKEAKGNKSAKVNVDGNGVILKGYDAVAFFEQGSRSKGIPQSKVATGALHTYLHQKRIKPLLTKIPQSMPRNMADFVPTE
jgi:hypothetical protein